MISLKDALGVEAKAEPWDGFGLQTLTCDTRAFMRVTLDDALRACLPSLAAKRQPRRAWLEILSACAKQ